MYQRNNILWIGNNSTSFRFKNDFDLKKKIMNTKSLITSLFLLLVSFNLKAQDEPPVQLHVESISPTPGGKGIYVNGEGIGIHVDSLAFGVYSSNADFTGIYSDRSGGNGIISANSNFHNFQSIEAGQDGFRSGSASNYGHSSFYSGNSGFYTLGAGVHGFHSESSNSVGFYTNLSNSYGFRSDNSGQTAFLAVDAEGNGFQSNNAETSGFYSIGSGGSGFRSINAGSHGFSSQNATGNGLRVTSSQGDGVSVTDAQTRAAFFTNRSFSASPAVYIAHGNNTRTDLLLGGTGRINAQRSIVMRIDEDDNENSSFIIRNGDNLDVMQVSENGNLTLAGNISKGGGTFKIDHPLHPTEKYLYHSFVESPDMMNIYNGNIETDQEGYAEVALPSYFEALNMEFRYQLTSIGTFGQVIIKEEIENGRFMIQSETPKTKVSWQVTGIRKDNYAEANRVQVEVDKEPEAIGTYLHPEVWINHSKTKTSTIGTSGNNFR